MERYYKMLGRRTIRGLGVRYPQIILLLLLCCACATTVTMKRCPIQEEDENLWTCPSEVQGIYRDCTPPKDLYRCTDPQ